MSWEEVHRIQQLESQVRKLEDRLAALEASRVINVLGHRQDITEPLELNALTYPRASRADPR